MLRVLPKASVAASRLRFGLGHCKCCQVAAGAWPNGRTDGRTDGHQTQLNDKLSVLPVAGCTLPVASCPIASCLVPGPCCCCCCPCLWLCPRCGSVFYEPHVSMCSHSPLPLTLSLPLSLSLAGSRRSRLALPAITVAVTVGGRLPLLLPLCLCCCCY